MKTKYKIIFPKVFINNAKIFGTVQILIITAKQDEKIL